MLIVFDDPVVQNKKNCNYIGIGNTQILRLFKNEVTPCTHVCKHVFAYKFFFIIFYFIFIFLLWSKLYSQRILILVVIVKLVPPRVRVRGGVRVSVEFSYLYIETRCTHVCTRSLSLCIFIFVQNIRKIINFFPKICTSPWILNYNRQLHSTNF